MCKDVLGRGLYVLDFAWIYRVKPNVAVFYLYIISDGVVDCKIQNHSVLW